MAEYTQKRWRCDHCGRDVKRGTVPPPGWHEASGFYGVAAHCCADAGCVAWLRGWCEENGYTCDTLGPKSTA